MAKTHDLGPLYVQRLRYISDHTKPRNERFPLIARNTSHEIEHPYRKGRCLVFRLPLTRTAIVVGLWGRPGDEDSMLAGAIGCRQLGPLDLDTDRDWRNQPAVDTSDGPLDAEHVA